MIDCSQPGKGGIMSVRSRACSVTIGVLAATAIGMGLAGPAYALAPSKAHIKFKVPSTMGQTDSAGNSAFPAIVVWVSGASNTPGVGCCTSKVFDNGTALGQTTQTSFPVTITSQGTHIGPYQIKSWDANNAFVGSTVVDPNVFEEDSYVNDQGADCSSPYGFSSGWSTVSNPDYLGGTSCLSKAAGSSFAFRSDYAVAWVTTTGPGHGSAKVYINGVYTATVSTYSPNIHYRQVVCQRRFGSCCARTIKIVNLHTAHHPIIEVDAQATISSD
jgi:hypothetical protein